MIKADNIALDNAKITSIVGDRSSGTRISIAAKNAIYMGGKNSIAKINGAIASCGLINISSTSKISGSYTIRGNQTGNALAPTLRC